MELTPDEFKALADLISRGGSATSTGLVDRRQFDAMVDRGLMKSAPIGLDTVMYEISAAGRTAYEKYAAEDSSKPKENEA
jgi:hypothetical protein